MANTKTIGLAGKLAKAMASVHGVRKDGRNDFHKYDYVTSDAVTAEVREALAEQGVFFMPSVDEVLRGQAHVTLKMTMRFFDGETGEVMESTWYSEASDKGDKAINKAQTAGVKYFLLKAFLVPVNNEPDADSEGDTKEARPANDFTFEQAKAALANAETDAQRKQVAARIKAASFTDKERDYLRREFISKGANGKPKGKMAQLAETAAADDKDLPGGSGE